MSVTSIQNPLRANMTNESRRFWMRTTKHFQDVCFHGTYTGMVPACAGNCHQCVRFVGCRCHKKCSRHKLSKPWNWHNWCNLSTLQLNQNIPLPCATWLWERHLNVSRFPFDIVFQKLETALLKGQCEINLASLEIVWHVRFWNNMCFDSAHVLGIRLEWIT